MSNRLEIYSLGGLVLKVDESLITLESQKAAALLIYLAMTGREQPREHLAELLFAERTQQQSLTNLRVVIHRLRQHLDPFLFVSRQTIGLNPEQTHWLDVATVDNILTTTETRLRQGVSLTNSDATALENAFALYKGDFLAGFSVNESEGFESWVRDEREKLRTRLITAIYQLIRHYADQKAYSLGIAKAMRLLQIDPSHEPTHQQLLMLLARSGQRSIALTQHEAFKTRLADEFGLDISPETEGLYQQILSGALSTETALPQIRQIPLAVRGVATSNLPIPATAFVGRMKEVKTALDSLDKPDCRLLTLVGQGGIGKTRLAIQLANERIQHFDYGVHYIALASIDAPHLLTITLANALKLSIVGEKDVLSQIITYLHDKNILLIFDNFEHLLDAANVLADILAQCPYVKLLVTSRERLNLSAEWLLSIAGLSYPSATVEPTEPETYDAMKLFAHSAQRIQSEFLLSEHLESATRICQLVEGMPLAIEIAVGWLWSMSCAQIADQISRDIDFLQTSVRDIPARHRSIRAIFEHSWKMLSDSERTGLASLAVFQGSFDLTATQTVAYVSPFILERLINKSLLRVEGNRYNMHEMMRQYAEEKSLEDRRAYRATRGRHAEYYLRFLQARDHALSSYETKTARQEIKPEFDNIRSAWLWAAAEGSDTPVRDIAPIMEFFYWAEGRYHEAIHVFGQAVECLKGTPVVSADLRARQARFYLFLSHWQEGEALLNQSLQASDRPLEAYILNQLAYSAYMQSRYDEAVPLFEKALLISQAMNDRKEQVFTLMSLAHIAEVRGNYPQAKAYYDDSLIYARELENPFSQSQIMNGLGKIATSEGLHSDARIYLEKAIALQRTLAHPQLLAQSLVRVGWVALREANYEEAEKHFRESLSIYQDLGHRQGTANAMNGLGSVLYMDKKYEEAKPVFLECLDLYHEIGVFTGKASILGNLGSICWSTGHYQEAERLFQESFDIYQHAGNQMMMAVQLLNLGNAAMMLSDHVKAWRQFQKALEQSMRIGAVGVSLGILVDVAKLLLKAHRKPLALEIIAFVVNHPITTDNALDEATLLLREIEMGLEQLPTITEQPNLEDMIEYIVSQGGHVFI